MCACVVLLKTGVFAFRGFLNTSITEILKYKNLCNESSIKLVKKYYFEILVLMYLKIPGPQKPLLKASKCLSLKLPFIPRKDKPLIHVFLVT